MAKKIWTPERFATELSQFADNNPRFRRGEVDGFKVEIVESLNPPELYPSSISDIEHNLAVRRYTAWDEKTRRDVVGISFQGGTTLTGPPEDMPPWIAKQVPFDPENPGRSSRPARKETGCWYELNSIEPSEIYVGTTIRYLDAAEDPLYVVSDEEWSEDDMTGTPWDEFSNPDDPATQNYHYQRRLREVVYSPPDKFDEDLALDTLVASRLNDEAMFHYMRSNVRLAAMCFQALREALRQQAGLQ